MTTQSSGAGDVKGIGFNNLIAWARFTPVNGAAPTVVSSFGVNLARTGEGVWTATLVEKMADSCVVIQPEYSGTAYYETRVSSYVPSTGVATITHKFCTYATIVSAGPVADDVSGLAQVTVYFYGTNG